MISLRDAAAALHDEAHADDKVPFEHYVRPSCKDMHEALDDSGAPLWDWWSPRVAG